MFPSACEAQVEQDAGDRVGRGCPERSLGIVGYECRLASLMRHCNDVRLCATAWWLESMTQ